MYSPPETTITAAMRIRPHKGSKDSHNSLAIKTIKVLNVSSVKIEWKPQHAVKSVLVTRRPAIHPRLATATRLHQVVMVIVEDRTAMKANLRASLQAHVQVEEALTAVLNQAHRVEETVLAVGLQALS